MKKTILALMLAALAAGCTSRTSYGECVGVFDDKDPHLTYKLEPINTVLAVFLSGTVVVPVLVVANETFCPVGRK